MKTRKHLKSFLLYAGAFLTFTFVGGCSNDDDGTAEQPKGMIYVDNNQNLVGNVLTVSSVTVSHDSWLAAVPEGEETSNNFIAQPVMVIKGTKFNVQLNFDETAIESPDGHQVVLKLYVDNQNRGTIGEWDISDEPIKLANNMPMFETITVYPDLTDYDWFEYFDSNGDDTLDAEEVLETYPSVFEFYNKNQITPDEFYLMIYYSTDTDLDAGISEDEWKVGHLRMFSNWAGDNFTDFDKDQNEFLDLEEWWEIFEESEWFETYDSNSDNLLTEDELNKGFFTDWDLDNDGKIDEDEFNNYRPFATNMKFTAPVWEW